MATDNRVLSTAPGQLDCSATAAAQQRVRARRRTRRAFGKRGLPTKAIGRCRVSFCTKISASSQVIAVHPGKEISSRAVSDTHRQHLRTWSNVAPSLPARRIGLHTGPSVPLLSPLSVDPQLRCRTRVRGTVIFCGALRPTMRSSQNASRKY
jgi:hypothetical protein